MKKVFLIIIVLCLLLVGCKKTGGWELDMESNRANMEEEALEIFKNTAKDKYEVVALLGTQVVAGTNYMYLVRDDSYKVIIIYHDLEGNNSIISEKEFDITKYTHKDSTPKVAGVVGGWRIKIPQKKTALEDDVKEAFENASKEVEGITYYPAAVLGHQLVSGTNYAILAYGLTDAPELSNGIYLLTLYKGLDGTEEIISSSYIDLTDYGI